MEIFSPTRGVDYNSGYFVIYERKVSKESGKLSKWRIAGTYATPSSAIKANTANAELIPLWEESKRKSCIRQAKPENLT
jgi:hypothetical protein